MSFSEGLNLQDATRLINYDLHWNPVRLMQRIGRVDRRMNPEVEALLLPIIPSKQPLRGRVVYWNFLAPRRAEQAAHPVYEGVAQDAAHLENIRIEGGKLPCAPMTTTKSSRIQPGLPKGKLRCGSHATGAAGIAQGPIRRSPRVLRCAPRPRSQWQAAARRGTRGLFFLLPASRTLTTSLGDYRWVADLHRKEAGETKW